MGQLGFFDADRRLQALSARGTRSVLQAINNLSDEQVEYQVRDRLSFSRCLGFANRFHNALLFLLSLRKCSVIGAALDACCTELFRLPLDIKRAIKVKLE